jgi:mono/diheme cytochrome c family protein
MKSHNVSTSPCVRFLLGSLACLTMLGLQNGSAGRSIAAEPVKQPATAEISYTQHIEPIFRAHCQGCHQPAKAQGSYSMVDYTGLLKAGESGEAAVVPGKPEESYLLAQITPAKGVAAMPKKSAALSAEDRQLIHDWIAAGAINDSVPAGSTYSAEQPPVYSRPPLITALAFSPDGRWLAVSGFQEVLLLDATTRETVRRLVGLSERIESLSFSPDSLRLAVTGGSPGRLGEVQVWEVTSGELLLSKQVTYDTLYGGRFSPDGQLIAFGCSDNTVRAIDSHTGEQKLHQGAHEDWIAACVFSPDGKHVVSAGRDMTVKLTEVETERFIDNITSITPGALRGGISSLAMHPERPEVLVGGADGVPKVYRLFRETERRIGDDANLIRAFPVMPGRIFSLAIGPGGKYLAAASTLDGHSQVTVYPYDFDGALPDDVKLAMAKRIAERNDEESKLLKEYTSRTSAASATLELKATSLYALAFAPDGQHLVLGGSDGIVRWVGVQDGLVKFEVTPVPLSNAPSVTAAQSELQAGHGRSLPSDAIPSIELEAKLLPTSRLVDLTVEPQHIDLASVRESVQLVVTGHFADGQACDVTRLVQVHPDSQIQIDRFGLVRPLNGGSGKLRIEYSGMTRDVTVQISDLSERPAVDFVHDVNPLLSRLGCNSGTCHGAQKGRNGFKLSLRGYDPLEDIRALSDDLSSRRLSAAAPDSSLMLLKPTGLVPHEGGVLLTTDSVHYEILRAWIAEGAQLDAATQKVARIEVFPRNPVIEREQAWQQFRIVAFYADGRSRDVTHEAFVESGDMEVCKSYDGGRVQAVRRGEAPILARYEGAYAAATVTVMGERDGFAWAPPETFSTIDQLVAAKWQRMKTAPSPLCNDSEFLRRVRLDLTGLPPSVEELKSFLADPRPTKIKRSEKIDQLLGSTDYVEHWTNKWADLLQVNSKFIGTEGAKSFRQWIRQAVDENRPYDQFARDVLTAQGSNKDNPAASYFKILRDPDLIMENTTHLFLAIRFNCNKCHDHPFERWTQDQYYELAAYFAQTGLKADPASGNQKIGGSAVEGAKPLYEEVYDQPTGEMLHVRTNQPVAPSFPFSCDYTVREDASRRDQLAAWITSRDNPYFSKSFVNRLWGYLTGVGLMMPLDDIRAGNPPTNPELLDHLSSEFIRSNFDVKHVLRMICNSRTYQLSVGTNAWNQDDRLNYSHATARRLPAEVLYDALYSVTGALSDIPGVAPGTRAAALPDVAVALDDGFLNNLGRPVRESACECERSQELQLGPVMALVSGPTVGKAISDPQCALPKLAKQTELSESQIVQAIYLRVLSREATDQEVATVVASADNIQVDHQTVLTRLAEREAWWTKEREQRETLRLQQLAEAQLALAARQAAIAPERAKLEQERVAKLADAEKALSAFDALALDHANKFISQHTQLPNWYPLAPIKVASSAKADIAVLADRSLVVSGNADKGITTITYRTPLRGIRGFRLEALPYPSIPGGGPGLAPNGNFVVTEIELDAAPVGNPKQKMRVPIARGKADFSQPSFAVEQAFDAQTRDQRGWAVSPQAGVPHWAVFETKEPIDFDGDTQLTFSIHQFHNADQHRLAHFRISVTTDAGEIGLGLPEEFAWLDLIPVEKRTAENLKGLVAYQQVSDAERGKLASAVARLKGPLAEDGEVQRLQALQAKLETPTVDDPKVVQLRLDAAASQQQVENRRLTLAQDLTWALINSPAFLFNH